MFKSLIEKRLENYVKKYFKKHPDVKLIAVSGSVGKTSSKLAIATVLQEKFRVRVHKGNHNTNLSAPIAILGIKYPKNVWNPLEWLSVFNQAKRIIRTTDDVDVIIQELGSDRVGQMAQFKRYLRPDIAVITAVSPEHMEFFQTIENVAKEELELANFSKKALINRDDIDDKYAKYITNHHINTYGTNASAEYHFIIDNFDLKSGSSGEFFAPELDGAIQTTIKLIGEHNLRPAISAGAVGLKLGLNADEVARGMKKIRSVPGRMSLIEGIDESIIIDDSYNSSPLAVMSALRTLYSINSPQKIAVLGSMNELGESSALEHQKVGEFCKSSELDWVITVGDEAEKFLAPFALKNGCNVKSFKTSLQAGFFLREIIEQRAVVLFKGSEGKIYLEEAIKKVILSIEDESRLVRQSANWMLIKSKFFNENIQQQGD